MRLIDKFIQITSWTKKNIDGKSNELNDDIQLGLLSEIGNIIEEEIPKELHQLYAHVNGEKGKGNGVFLGNQFLSLTGIIEALKFPVSLIKPKNRRLPDPEKAEGIIKEIVSLCTEAIPLKYGLFRQEWYKIEASFAPMVIKGPYLYPNKTSTSKHLKLNGEIKNKIWKLVDSIHKLEQDAWNWDDLKIAIYGQDRYEVVREDYIWEDEMDFPLWPEAAIKEKYFHYKWIPIFHDYGGNYIGIDLDPGKNGKKGQVITYGQGGLEMCVLGGDLNAFFDLCINEIANGGAQLKNEYHLHHICAEIAKNRKI